MNTSITHFATACFCFTVVAAASDDSPPLIAPWTPVTTHVDASGIETCVWGRKHRFANSALPTSVTTANAELLAGPIRLAGKLTDKPIEWKRGGNLLLRSTESHAVFSGWQSGDDLIINTTTRVEFDGLLKIDLVVLPQYKTAPKLEQLWLEVPLKREWATLYHYFPGSWGQAKNSGQVPPEGLTLPFKAFLWLGNETGGLGWFAESDQVWQPKDPKRAVEVIPGEKETLLRLTSNSLEPRSRIARKTKRPIRPKPLIAILMAILELLMGL